MGLLVLLKKKILTTFSVFPTPSPSPSLSLTPMISFSQKDSTSLLFSTSLTLSLLHHSRCPHATKYFPPSLSSLFIKSIHRNPIRGEDSTKKATLPSPTSFFSLFHSLSPLRTKTMHAKPIHRNPKKNPPKRKSSSLLSTIFTHCNYLLLTTSSDIHDSLPRWIWSQGGPKRLRTRASIPCSINGPPCV